MGYTHYWDFKGNVAPKDLQDGENKFAKVAEIVKVCLKKVTDKGIGIGAGSGNGGTPKISKTAIVFNGIGEGSCETFFVRSDDGEWNFCKTGEKPYDLLVCLSLLAFKEVFGDDFSYRSDGITREAYENRESNEYWKKIGFVPKGPSQGWATAYGVWDEVKKEMNL